MRRLSLVRERAKVRNPERHLRSLRRWAEGFAGYYPIRGDDSYINFKIPVLDRLVCPPTAKPEWQRQAMESLLIAAHNLVSARPEQEMGRSSVAVLADYPDMWSSEVTVFFSRDYYSGFIGTDGSLNGFSLCERLGVKIPQGFIETGSMVYWNDDEDENATERAWERWTISEPL